MPRYVTGLRRPCLHDNPEDNMPPKIPHKITAACLWAVVCILQACDSGKPVPHERLDRVERTLGTLQSGAINNPSVTTLREFMAHVDLPQQQRTRMAEFFNKQPPADMLAQALATLRRRPHVQTLEGDEIYQVEGLGEILVSGATDKPRLTLNQPGNLDVVVLVVDTLKPAATLHVDLAKVVVAQRLSGQRPTVLAEGILTLQLDLSPTAKPFIQLSTGTGVHVEEGDSTWDIDATATGVSAYPQANGEVMGVIAWPASHGKNAGKVAQAHVTPRVWTSYTAQSNTAVHLDDLTFFGPLEQTIGHTTQRLHLEGTHTVGFRHAPAAEPQSIELTFETPGVLRLTEQIGQADWQEVRAATWSADTVLLCEGTPNSPETMRARKLKGTVLLTTLGQTKSLGPDEIWELGSENAIFQQLLRGSAPQPASEPTAP